MAPFTRRSPIVRSIAGTATVVGLLAACGASTGNTEVHQAPRAAEQAACQPQVLLLPTRTEGDESAATAINNDGWVAGWLTDPNGEKAAVLWRDNAPPLDLGVRGLPGDINDDGVILINHVGRRHTAFLWENGAVRRLSGTSSRPMVNVSALNDDGVAVGMVWGHGTSRRAAAWRNGQIHVLRPPSGAPPEKNYASADVNDRGLIIGWGYRSWWHTGDRAEKLLVPAGMSPSARARATHVDNRGRILGFILLQHEGGGQGPVLRWTSVHRKPTKYPSWRVSALDPTSGFLVGFDRRSSRTSVAHITNMRPAPLPDPPVPAEGITAEFTEAEDVATGRSPYAPDGGVAVAGFVHYVSDSGYSRGRRAVLWTCAQTYR